MKQLILVGLLSVVGLQAQNYISPDARISVQPFLFIDLCGAPPTFQIQSYCEGKQGLSVINLGYLLEIKPKHSTAVGFSYKVSGSDASGVSYSTEGLLARKDSPLGFSQAVLYFGAVLVGRIEVEVRELGVLGDKKE